MAEEILSAVSDQVFGVWFLIGAALVFWMQAGFAMVEAGFTRAKNSGNILMKNLMDFCIGTVMFILIGFSLLPIMRILIGLLSYSIWYFVRLQQQSYQGLWQKGQNFYPTAFILQ